MHVVTLEYCDTANRSSIKGDAQATTQRPCRFVATSDSDAAAGKHGENQEENMLGAYMKES